MALFIDHEFLSSRSGSTAVEFALVITPFLLLMFGTIEIGRYYWFSNALESLAIETVRCLSVDAIELSIKDAKELCLDELNTSRIIPFTPDVPFIDPVTNCAKSDIDGDTFWFIELQHAFKALLVPLDLEISAEACFPIQSQ